VFTRNGDGVVCARGALVLVQVGNANGLVPQLLNMLTSALEDENAAGAASLALRNLCDHCSSHMGPYLEGLMALYQAQMRTLAAGQQTKLEAEDVEQLVQVRRRDCRFWKRVRVCCVSNLKSTRSLSVSHSFTDRQAFVSL
jgi:predicted O-linked N-acetylglucosamine transferase (SPINDLY family)